MKPSETTLIKRQILGRFDEWFLNQFVGNGFDSIKLCDVNADPTDNAAFYECAKEVLALVRRTDHRRYLRIRKHLKYIANADLLSGANYRHSSNSCRIDFGRLYFEEYREWTIWYFASALVHEATHGLIWSRGIEYSRSHRSQIERICRTEQNRFLRHAPCEIQKQLIRPYTPDDWAESWNRTRLEYFTGYFQRWRQSIRKAEGDGGSRVDH